jgi:hypothetical protein
MSKGKKKQKPVTRGQRWWRSLTDEQRKAYLSQKQLERELDQRIKQIMAED